VLLEQKHIIGYATFNPSTGRIPQFAIDKNFRRKRYGTRLFNEIARQVGKEIVLINTDGRDTATNEFLSKIGLKLFIRQLEMELIIE
jgi:GNAT superfamily N-acetyltransferase